MSGPFLLFGATENSWAVGNNSWRACQKLPRSYAPHFEDDTFTGFTIRWFAVARNGLHYFSLQGTEIDATPVLRSPDPNLENDTAIGINSAGEPVQEVNFMSFAPGGGYFVGYIDGSVRLSATGEFPASFHELAAIFINAGPGRQMSALELVFFGADGFLAISSAGQIFSDGLSEELQSNLAAKHADGWSLGKESNLCQWDNTQYFLAWKREIPYSNGQIETSYSWNIKPSGWLTDELLCEVTEGRIPTSHISSPPSKHPAILSIKGPKKEVKPLVLGPDEFLARPLRSYEATNPHELSIKKGETLTNVRRDVDAWYLATNEKGEQGVVLRSNISLWNNPVYFDDGVGYNCDSCKDLIEGVFYHCDICGNGDFDICQKCYIGWGNQCYDPGHVLTLKQQLDGRCLTCEDPAWTIEETETLLEILNADVSLLAGISSKIHNVVNDMHSLHIGSPTPPQVNNDTKPVPHKDISEILELSIHTEQSTVQWEEVVGLDKAKEEIQEAVILPMKLPHLFRGKRKAKKGVLLYGPPGTGKSHIAKAVAADIGCTFLSINFNEILSKWADEAEIIIKIAFERARATTPTILFLSALSALPTGPLKTTVLSEIDASPTITLFASSTAPWTLDLQFRKRFQTKVHVSLPDEMARTAIFGHGLADTPCEMGPADYARLARMSEGMSAAQILDVVEEAVMVPVKKLSGASHFKQIITADGVEKLTPCNAYDSGAIPMKWTQVPVAKLQEPALVASDFFALVNGVKPAGSKEDVVKYEKWSVEFGSN